MRERTYIAYSMGSDMQSGQAIIDTNLYLSRWPFRRLYGDQPQELMAKLRLMGVVQGWVGSFDALLHRDIASVNARLVEDCRQFGAGLLLPFGTVNPRLPDWKEELRRCHEDHRMQGLRLFPGWHGYKLDDSEAAELIALATQRRMLIQIVVQTEDERTQHPLVQVPNASIAKLPALLRSISDLRVQLLNVRTPLQPPLKELVKAGSVYIDFAMVEGVHGVKRLAEMVGTDRVTFGSYFPFYYFESALLKVKEAELDPAAVLQANARRLLGDLR
jgi:predicted TIM-barrel fold metal-dependent hydrolase